MSYSELLNGFCPGGETVLITGRCLEEHKFSAVMSSDSINVVVVEPVKSNCMNKENNKFDYKLYVMKSSINYLYVTDSDEN